MRPRRKFRCWICRRIVQAAAYLDEQGLLEDAQRDGEEACHECSDTVRSEAIEDAIEHRSSGRVSNEAYADVAIAAAAWDEEHP